jgi:hypothetical protein
VIADRLEVAGGALNFELSGKCGLGHFVHEERAELVAERAERFFGGGR